MKKKSMIITKALLDRAPAKTVLFNYFSQEEARELQRLPEYPSFDLHELILERTSVDKIHYSWFQELFLKMTEQERAPFFSIFEEKVAKKLQQLIGHSSKNPAIPKVFHPLLALELKKRLQKEEILAPQCLPQDETLILLKLNKEQLVRLIDLLGIYDLAADLRQIVDKSVLSSIASSLTSEQRSFLQHATKQSVGYLPERLNLKAMSNDKAYLNKLLHKRGLQRLGGAICMQEKDFIWHLLHILDTGRAMILEKIVRNPPEMKLVSLFKRQVIPLARRIQEFTE